MTHRHANVATPYSAVYMIFRKDNKIAFLLRSHTGWMNGHYGLPAGRVDKGESILTAAAREAEEEVGISLQPEHINLVLVAHRNEPDSVWIDLIFEVSAWDGELSNAEPDKHSELSWFDPDSLPDNMVSSVRAYVKAVQTGKSYIELGWD